jgi:hypothetical protein
MKPELMANFLTKGVPTPPKSRAATKISMIAVIDRKLEIRD